MLIQGGLVVIYNSAYMVYGSSWKLSSRSNDHIQFSSREGWGMWW